MDVGTLNSENTCNQLLILSFITCCAFSVSAFQICIIAKTPGDEFC